MMEARHKGGGGSRLPGAYLLSVAPCTFQPWKFTAMKFCFSITVGEDVMLTYLCVLITQLAARLTDCQTYQRDDYLTICTIDVGAFFVLVLHLEPLRNESGCSKVAVVQVNSAYRVSSGKIIFKYQIAWSKAFTITIANSRSFPPKRLPKQTIQFTQLSLLTFILVECGCKASSISASNFRFQLVQSRYFAVFTVKN